MTFVLTLSKTEIESLRQSKTDYLIRSLNFRIHQELKTEMLQCEEV